MNCSIIGVSIRLPEGVSNEEYWKALLNETSFLKGMSPDRQQLHKNEQSRSWSDLSTVKGMYLDDIDCFDRRLFNLSKPALMFADPRQRTLLESCWNAIEDAGLRVSELKGKKVGVFIAHDSFDMSSYFRNIPESELSAQEFVIPGNVTSFLANRISNVFDFKGPSLVVNTTCSSSYVAIHYARLALEKGECDYAIVGGVTLFLEPWKTGASSPTSFEANVSDIKSFGDKATGYCSSEGCGAILLQRSHPEDDKEHCSYGVIIGSGHNAGGKTQSFAKPNQEQQEVLLKTILKEAGKDPKDVEYIESHGIGSEVGDAIEANALINIFKRDDSSFCYISTIKPNIGHTHAASGLYSLCKALLAIKYKRIPGIKGLDITKLNKAISKERNGIQFVTKSIDWNKEENSEKRLVFLTSYGFSNVNAGILIQEADQYPQEKSKSNSEDVLICLSAETEIQLEKQKERLLDFIDSSTSQEEVNLKELAYTLQIGREPFRYRFATKVNSLDQLKNRLSVETELQDVVEVGDIRFPLEFVKELLENKQALDEHLVKSFEEGNFENLARLWVQGVNMKWGYCYKDKVVRRLHLPTYPFAREHYWIPNTKKTTSKRSIEKLHPLVHSNISNLSEHKYQSVFSGKERFLSDHKVRGEKVFPGVAHIELARAAGERSIHKPISQLRNIKWLHPIYINDTSNTVEISLFEHIDAIGYEVYSKSGELEVIHGQGTLYTDALTPPPSYNIAMLKEGLLNKKTADECYAFFEKKNLSLGATYQGIVSFYYNDNEALSRVEFPNEEGVFLPLGLLDSALQTSAILNLSLTKSLAVPFSVKEVAIYGQVSAAAWCYARKSTRNKESQVDSYDIDVLSHSGDVLISFTDFVTLPIDGFSQELYQENPQDQVKDETSTALDKVLNKNIDQKAINPINIERKRIKVKATKYFKELVSSVLQLSAEDIETTEPFEKYGIDSIMISKLTNRLDKVFKDLSSTLFFEYQNLEGLINYFIEEHSIRLVEIIGVNKIVEEQKDTNFHNSQFDSAISHRSRFSVPIKKRTTFPDLQSKEDIAIIGISGRYPKANNMNEFWENLKSGTDCITEIPRDRWDVQAFYDPEKGKGGRSYSKWGGFIKDVDKFDPLFFNISPREAELIDPQERLFLQTVWECIEDAGYTKEQLQEVSPLDNATLIGHVGVYAGVMYSEYQLFGIEETVNGNPLALWNSPGSIANRVSYFLNLHGPSMAIDTMCSSSLTAIHLAIEAIHNGQCTMAIAGGVNVSVHPNKYKMLSQGMFISDKGKCESFGEGGEGYVPSEGVGAILLKPISKAEADGDQIYGLIKGNSINHGGKTNGYTVPNPNAQTNVIKEAMKRAGIQPEEYSYIEAHGTGTSLGDPIEITGLSNAFESKNKGKQYCSIGSVKSNIGHGESAAGISGLTKILLQLKYKQLVPSLHSKTLNTKINFKKTPFRVQQELEDWVVENNKPRIAGISSFGAGGANSHIIIEEYIPKKKEGYSSDAPVLIVLSAKNEERLKVQVENLGGYLKSDTALNLYDIAYTLQVGREAMNARLAFLAGSIDGLKEQLHKYLQGNTDGLCIGNIKRDKSDFILQGNAGRGYIEIAIRDKELGSLAQLWVRGVAIDWLLVYGSGKYPNKISLPTYPFARERYWIPESEEKSLEKGQSHLHPLVHANTSNFQEQRFTSTYTGSETFFIDHRVQGKKVLPGVAYLELARAAGSISLERDITQLKDVTWQSPIFIEDSPLEVTINLEEKGEGRIGYGIYSGPGGSELVHGQGDLLTASLPPPPPPLDLMGIRKRLSNEKKGPGCYSLFRDLGFDYGNSFQGIEQLYYTSEESLSKIGLPRQEGYFLQPGILDSAIQTCMGLGFLSPDIALHLPFGVGELNIYGSVSDAVWCYARKGPKNKPNSKVCSYDIDLLSGSGAVLLAFRDFVTLPLDGFQPTPGKPKKEEAVIEEEALHLYGTQWQQESVPAQEGFSEFTPLILLSGGSADLADKLMTTIEAEVIPITSKTVLEYYIRVQEIVQSRLKSKIPTNILVIYNNAEYMDYGFISGLLKTSGQESRLLKGKTIGVAGLSISSLDSLIMIIESEQANIDKEVRYSGMYREVRKVVPLMTEPVPDQFPIKEGGVYLITGGCGGLGQVFAKHFSSVSDVTLILTGRNKEGSIDGPSLKALKSVYYCCDVTDMDAVGKLIKEILASYGRLDGIVHSAGVVRDSFLLHKTVEECTAVLLTKVMGAKYLDLFTRELDLDFMIYFSSISGILGNVGQADYASANAWLDAYAGYRESLRLAGKRKGISLSINWPLWQEGGMKMDAASEQYMAHKWGMYALPTQQGIIALQTIVKEDTCQGIVTYGKKSILETVLLGNVEEAASKKEKLFSVTSQKLQETATTYFKTVVSSVLKLPIAKIEITDTFEEYGIDSIMITGLTNHLNKVFDDIPSTLFFEYQNLKDVIDYFISEHHDRLVEVTGISEKIEIQHKQDFEDVTLKNQVERRYRLAPSSKSIFSIESKIKEDKHDIAIIGLSGRYPGANNMSEFWENLKSGIDCITEIPEGRWNLNELYDAEKGKIGKSYSKWGGFISDIDKFDPLFFNISPKDAELMDPQERLFLQTVWETLEDAGYTRDHLQQVKFSENLGLGGHVGVYAGVMYGEYQFFGIEETLKGNPLAILSSPGSIANRISYHLNLHGPSIAVDTMCSSSLTAIHLAVDAIHNGQCSMAIAGGVNVSVHPNKYKMLSHRGFISGKGRCESFGEGGEGYVPSEGVGAVLLKPLSKAEADDDLIYGIIKGSSLNHGGKTNGYTVPNPNAQAVVVKEAMGRAGIKPEEYSYIEAHGTGTSLGDPIEIAGLSKAFKNENTESQYCSIGSVKSNIGHGESAAGIAGLSKILLQLKYKQIVPSLHSGKLNTKINFKKTPFRVQQELEDWIVQNNKPRVCGISSFGAGGSNAHIIIKEYISKKRTLSKNGTPIMIVLSAKNEERLKDQVGNLTNHINGVGNINLHDVAYTLQVGRESMVKRLAFITTSIADLLIQLKEYEKGTKGHWFSNTVNNDSLSKENNDKEAIINALKNKELEFLGQRWVQGTSIDWAMLYEKDKELPHKISLPTYPFARERYWIPESQEEVLPNLPNIPYPLLSVDTFDFEKHTYKKVYTGLEYFFMDHKVQSEKIFPGVAYLEVARQAGKQCMGKPITQFHDVNWFIPIRSNGNPVAIEIDLIKDGSYINYEIFSLKNDKREVINAIGRLSSEKQVAPSPYDIPLIKNRMAHQKQGSECYELFEKIGLEYGASFQGIEHLYYSDEESLSRITLLKNKDNILQIGILDSALQTCMGLSIEKEKLLSIPLSVEKIQVYRDINKGRWCYAQKSKSKKESYKGSNYDIDLLDDSGAVLLRFENFVTMPFAGFSKEKPPVSEMSINTHLYNDYWRASDLKIEKNKNHPESQLIFVVGGSEKLIHQLNKNLGIVVETISKKSELTYFIEVVEKIQVIMSTRTSTDLTFVIRNSDYLHYSFISGLLKTAHQENSKIKGKIIGVDSLSIKKISGLTKLLSSEKFNTSTEVRYIQGQREERVFTPLILDSQMKETKIKEGGVYLITGGTGGLGLVFAKHISATKNTKIILTGRSEFDTHKSSIIGNIPGAEYYSCDVTDKGAVMVLIKKIKAKYAKIDGIIHSAGVNRDCLIIKKKSKDIKEVLNAKIEGVKNLDQATKNEALDFMILFSSVSGVLGNIGQSDYAAANAYLDNYALFRNKEKDKGKRKGQTISINWPLWEEGGMQLDNEAIEYLYTRWGIKPLPSNEGVKIFDAILQNTIETSLVLFGENLEQLEKNLPIAETLEKNIDALIDMVTSDHDFESIDDFLDHFSNENLDDLISVFTNN